MSFSPAATTQATGECVVCGKETVTRCSACAKSGTEWMFFCSTEHQKLVSSSRPLLSARIRAESSAYIDLEGTQTSLRRQVKSFPNTFPFEGRDFALRGAEPEGATPCRRRRGYRMELGRWFRGVASRRDSRFTPSPRYELCRYFSGQATLASLASVS